MCAFQGSHHLTDTLSLMAAIIDAMVINTCFLLYKMSVFIQQKDYDTVKSIEGH